MESTLPALIFVRPIYSASFQTGMDENGINTFLRNSFPFECNKFPITDDIIAV
jgi:hypothetical protein